MALEGERNKQQKLADKWVREWAEESILSRGLSRRDSRFYTGDVVVWRSSIKDLLGHIADPTQKMLVMKVEEILRTCRPKEGNEYATLY